MGEVAHGNLDRWWEVYDDPHDEHGMPHADCMYCGTAQPWWAHALPQHAFLREGLVHLTNPWSPECALCGMEAVPYGVRLYSTDEAHAYARMLGDLRLEVSCFHCIALDMLFPRGHEAIWP